MAIPILTFDIELDKLVPSTYDSETSWELPSKPKITCAATCEMVTGRTKTYWTPSTDGKRLAAKVMSKELIHELVDDLYSFICRGGMIVSWGGPAVDFRALHACSEDINRKQMCIFMARTQIDIPFASSSEVGFMFSLNSAAKGMGLVGKDSSISFNAPQLWDTGRELEVLHQVQGDAILTAAVYFRTMNNPSLNWITQRGKTKTWKPYIIQVPMGGGYVCPRMQTVEECMNRPKAFVPFVTPHGLDRDYAIKWIDKFSTFSHFQGAGIGGTAANSNSNQ